MIRLLVSGAALAAAAVLPASAATVSLSGPITNSCVLSVPTSGVMVPEANGTVLRSDSGSGARSASLTVVALGLSPTLTFSTPQYSGPAGVTPDTVEFGYSAAGSGANRGYAATGATASSNLIDTFTVNGKIARATGFPTGTYAMSITVTCGQ